MVSGRRPTLKTLLLLASLALGGLTACGGTTLETATPSVTRRGIVRVTVEDVSKEVLQFKVHNLSKEPITIIKSQIEVKTPYGVIRMPQTTKVYEVPPGGQQPLAVKLTLKDMERKDAVEVHFDNALRQRGQPIAIDAVLFYVKHVSE
jgi:LEA14-like dessication related protein